MGHRESKLSQAKKEFREKRERPKAEKVLVDCCRCGEVFNLSYHPLSTSYGFKCPKCKDVEKSDKMFKEW